MSRNARGNNRTTSKHGLREKSGGGCDHTSSASTRQDVRPIQTPKRSEARVSRRTTKVVRVYPLLAKVG